MSDKQSVEQIKQQRMKSKMMSAYQDYLNGVPHSQEAVMGVVSDFAFTKVRHLEHDFKNLGTAETADDWAQDVSLKVWEALTTGKLRKKVTTPEAFYAWVHKVAFNKATDAFNDVYEESVTKVGLTVATKNEDGTEQEIENPEIFRALYGRVDRPIDMSGLNPDDRFIVGLRGDGKSYQQIADMLGIERKTIEKRMERLADRQKAKRDTDREFNLRINALKAKGKWREADELMKQRPAGR